MTRSLPAVIRSFQAMVAGAVLLVAPAARAQDTVFRVDVDLVRLVATVRDANGAPVGGLASDDFEVFDNGLRQEIAVFEHSTDLPLSVALLVDTSGSTAKKLGEETASVVRFLDTLFAGGNPADRVALYSFNHDVSLETPFTRRVGRLDKALRGLTAEAGTSLYDAIYFASRALRTREARRVILAVTDGADTTSVNSFQSALREAHMADAAIYSIMIMPVTNDAGRHIAGENALIALATGTGGAVFTASWGEMLDAALESVLRDLRTQYMIGYYPRNAPLSREAFHRVELTVKRPGLRAVTRSGYYGDYAEASQSDSGQSGPSRIIR